MIVAALGLSVGVECCIEARVVCGLGSCVVEVVEVAWA